MTSSNWIKIILAAIIGIALGLIYGWVIDPVSYGRYDRVVGVFCAGDAAQVAGAYQRLEPALDLAYRKLGYGDRRFREVLARAAAEILAVPVPTGPVQVVSTGQMYSYADPALQAFFLQSLDLKASPPEWRLNLDVLQAEMPKIVGWPGTIGRFDGPTLFLAGADSHYIKPDYRDGIRTLFPAARFAKLIGAGHWLHADKPREFEDTVRAFLDA